MENEFESRLAHQIEELVRSRVSVLEQDISRVQRQVNEAFTKLLESTDAAGSLPQDNGFLAQITAEVSSQVSIPAPVAVSPGPQLAELRDAVAQMGQQPSQAEVLNTLVARAASFAPRLVLFVVKGASALGWAARGFEDSVGDGSMRGISFPLQSDTILSAALSSQEPAFGSPYNQADNQNIFARLGNIQPEQVLAVPLKVRGKSAAVLYADSSDEGTDSINVEAIELLVGIAGLIIELTSLRARSGEASAPAKPKTDAKPQPTGQSGELRQPGPAPKPVARPVPEPVPAVQPAIQVARSAQLAEPMAVPTVRPVVSEAEEKLHSDARKFARLLVSEIKLYNEGKVVEGRRNNDLYDRLKEDIDRSRQMYDRRVGVEVSAKFDYFYDELVNTLAEGDPMKLGSDFPGPAIRVS